MRLLEVAEGVERRLVVGQVHLVALLDAQPGERLGIGLPLLVIRTITRALLATFNSCAQSVPKSLKTVIPRPVMNPGVRTNPRPSRRSPFAAAPRPNSNLD